MYANRARCDELLDDRRGREEQVHQHRFAATDRTEDVETLRRVHFAPACKAETLAPTAGFLARPIMLQRLVQGLQLLGRQFLRGVVRQRTAALQSAIARQGSVFEG